MALEVIHKHSTAPGTPPAPSDINVGEIAINAADAELYTKDTSGEVQPFKSKFLQSGTGAVPRLIESKLQDVVSVKDFGAVGDDVTDDTAAIQSAFDWWAAASNRTLTFPTGTYLCTSRINAVGNMNTNLVGNSLIGLGGRLKFNFATTGVEASRFGLVLDLTPQNLLMRELVISNLKVDAGGANGCDEYAVIFDGGNGSSSPQENCFLYGFTIEALTANGGMCISGNMFEGVVRNCYVTQAQGDGMDTNAPVPAHHAIYVTQADIIGGTGGTGGGARKISSLAIDHNNTRGGLNGIRVDDGAGDVTLRNNTTLLAYQNGLFYNGTFGGGNILHHHSENCWQQYSESSWGDLEGRGFFDQSGNRWSGISGDGSGAGTVADPIQGDWSEWYSAASSSDRNTVLQRSGIRVVSSGGGGNILGCRQIADGNGGTMSAVYIYATTDSPSLISGNRVSGMGTEICVAGPGSVFLNQSSYEIVSGWPRIIEASSGSTRPMIQGVAHGNGNNTNSQYTPFSQGFQSSIKGSVFIPLKNGVTINAPLAFNGSNSGYDAELGDELHFVFQQTNVTNATVTWDSIYDTNGFVAKPGTNALSAISFRYIIDSQGNNKWVAISNPGIVPDFGDQNITTTGSIRAEGGISFEDIPDPGNTLSEYEEGSFDPDLSVGGTPLGLTGNDALGSYTKIGNLCQVQIRLVVNSGDLGSNTGNLSVTGLPFASPNNFSSNYAIGAVGIKNMASSFKTGDKSIYATNSANSTNLGLFNGSISTGQLDDNDLDFTAGSCDFYISLTYRAA